MSEVKLLSSDGILFVTDRETVNCSKTITNALDIKEDDGNAQEIPLPNVHSKELKRLLTYAEYHKNDPQDDEDDCPRTLTSVLDMEVDNITDLQFGDLNSVLIYPEPQQVEPKLSKNDERARFDADFLDMEQSELYMLIEAANYLEMENLLQLSCKAVARMISGKTPEEVRNIINIQTFFEQ